EPVPKAISVVGQASRPVRWTLAILVGQTLGLRLGLRGTLDPLFGAQSAPTTYVAGGMSRNVSNDSNTRSSNSSVGETVVCTVSIDRACAVNRPSNPDIALASNSSIAETICAVDGTSFSLVSCAADRTSSRLSR